MYTPDNPNRAEMTMRYVDMIVRNNEIKTFTHEEDADKVISWAIAWADKTIELLGHTSVSNQKTEEE